MGDWEDDFSLSLRKIFTISLLSVAVCGHLDAAAHMWGSEGQSVEIDSLFPPVGSRD